MRVFYSGVVKLMYKNKGYGGCKEFDQMVPWGGNRKFQGEASFRNQNGGGGGSGGTCKLQKKSDYKRPGLSEEVILRTK